MPKGKKKKGKRRRQRGPSAEELRLQALTAWFEEIYSQFEIAEDDSVDIRGVPYVMEALGTPLKDEQFEAFKLAADPNETGRADKAVVFELYKSLKAAQTDFAELWNAFSLVTGHTGRFDDMLVDTEKLVADLAAAPEKPLRRSEVKPVLRHARPGEPAPDGTARHVLEPMLKVMVHAIKTDGLLPPDEREKARRAQAMEQKKQQEAATKKKKGGK